MKPLITTLAIATLAFLGSASLADARPQRDRVQSSYIYISGYRSCGTPIYTERYLVGYDHCGNPVFEYRRVAAPRYRHAPPRPRYYRPEPVCPPPGYHYRDARADSGIVIHGSIRL